MSKEPQAEQEIRGILASAKRIVIVGLSTNPDKDSRRVATYLAEQGYEVVGVNPSPAIQEHWPEAYTSLDEVPGPIDIVDLFLRPEFVPAAVDAAIGKRAGCVWMQLGIRDEEAAARAREAGLKVVMDRCSKIEHQRLI